jgi:hypothetical protein
MTAHPDSSLTAHLPNQTSHTSFWKGIEWPDFFEEQSRGDDETIARSPDLSGLR